MSHSTEESALRRVYANILKGHSVAQFKGRTAYVKHFSAVEQADIDEAYSILFEKAKKDKLLPEEIKLKNLAIEGVWSPQDEIELESKRSHYHGLIETKKNQWLPSQIEEINKQLNEAEKLYRIKLAERQELLGLTAEKHANNILNEIYIYKSLFKDKNCDTPLFSEEEYEEFDKEEIGELITQYNTVIEEFSDRKIKEIALSQFFQTVYYLCEDNIYHFFGKPIAYLTFFQSSVARYGRYFKSILSSENKPPEEVTTDPDKLIDWVMGKQNTDKIIQTSQSTGEGGAMSLVGATREDMEKLGIKEKTKSKSMQELASESGGELGMEHFLNFSGIK